MYIYLRDWVQIIMQCIQQQNTRNVSNTVTADIWSLTSVKLISSIERFNIHTHNHFSILDRRTLQIPD